jgi:RNA polymerase sigma factor (sigma-70 family)
MLETLALKHKLWVRMARGICKDNFLADDIVSEMYLKLKDYDKELNDFYIYVTLKSVWLDWIKRESNLRHSELHDNINIDEVEKDLIYEVPDYLTWVEKQILTLRYDKTAKEIEKQYHINQRTVFRIQQKAKEKINGKK